MDREEAIEIIRKNMPSDKSLPVYEAPQALVPELAESEDERTRKWLLDYAIEMIAGLESDISLSNYDGIKGHGPEAEAELAQWQKARAYLEKQKEPHYTKRNALFDKCVENCDPEIMQRVSDEVDEMLQKEQKPAWSEEDEKMVKEALYCVGYTFGNTHPLVAWLKSLKSHWQPSEEQMKALKAVAYNIVGTGTETDVHLVQLYEQLKRL